MYDAEDLTERVFYRALRHVGNYRDRGLPFSAWLYRIAHNLVANWHRDNSRRKEVPLEDTLFGFSSGEHPEYELLRLEEHERLMRVNRRLPEDSQQLLILKIVYNLSNAEIGQIMGRTEGAIKSLYHRTLLSIRDEFEIVQVDDDALGGALGGALNGETSEAEDEALSGNAPVNGKSLTVSKTQVVENRVKLEGNILNA